MPVNIDINIDLTSQNVIEFLYDAAQEQFTFKTQIPIEMDQNPVDVRLSDEMGGKLFNIPFMVMESWEMLINGTPSKLINNVYIVKSQQVDVSVQYLLYAKKISASNVVWCREKFREYDPSKHGNDVNKWISENITDTMTPSDIYVMPIAIITKMGIVSEIDHSQRDYLFSMYRQDGNRNSSVELYLMDYDLKAWGERNHVSWRFAGEVLAPQGKPKPDPKIVRTVPTGQAQDPGVAKGIIDQIVHDVGNQTDCGDLKTEMFKFLSAPYFPDCTIEMRDIVINIGCSKIVISIPVSIFRLRNMVVYAYYSVPVPTDQFVMKVCKACAERGVLLSGVFVMVTAQIEAAVPVFVEFFMDCVKADITRCVNPSLLGLVEYA